MNATPATDTAAPVFDLTAFPLVRMPMPAAGDTGYGERWVAEFDAILARETRFVLFSVGPMTETEGHDDRKARTLWLKRRRADLGRLCLAHLHVEPDPAWRAEMQAMVDSGRMAAAFPYPLALYGTEDPALERAWALLRAVPLTF